jgi:DNA-binding transcriptional LysR family regulator
MIDNRPADTRGLALRTVLPGRCIAAVGRTHPLARVRRLTLRRIAREPVILWRREINPVPYDAAVAAFRAAGGEPRALQYAEQLQTIVSLAAAGVGIGLVPSSYAAVRLDVVMYRTILDLKIPMNLELVWCKDAVSPVLASFLSALDHTLPRRRRRPPP